MLAPINIGRDEARRITIGIDDELSVQMFIAINSSQRGKSKDRIAVP